MRIKSISIKNFRSFKDCDVNLDDYTSLVGANGAGKSTVLAALNLFFRESGDAPTDVTMLDRQDYHERDISRPIEVEVTFIDLSDQERDEFAGYISDGRLVIKAIAKYDDELKGARVEQRGNRQVIRQFMNFFDIAKEKDIKKLRDEYKKMRNSHQDLPNVTAKPEMIEAIRSFEKDNPEKCEQTEVKKNFYGFGKEEGPLNKYVQWIYMPAVKDAQVESVEGKNTALGKILERAVRAKVNFDSDLEDMRQEAIGKYKKLLKSHNESLDQISGSLTSRLAMWSHSRAKISLSWNDDVAASVSIGEPKILMRTKERSFEGDLSRFGHGLQRSYLLALLQELVSMDSKSQPKLIFGCEEPELYQHPPQARYLASVLTNLSSQNAQVIVSTHSPHFICGKYFESLRMVRYDPSQEQSRVFEASFDAISSRIKDLTGHKISGSDTQMAKLQQSLQPGLSEMFFASKVVLVEGLEDKAYITSLLIASGKWDEFHRAGAHIIDVNGKSNLRDPFIIASLLGIPAFVVFDADNSCIDRNDEKSHRRNNVNILRLVGGDADLPFPENVVWGDCFVQWPDHIGKTLRSEISDQDWERTKRIAGSDLDSSVREKNAIRIGNHIDVLYKENLIPPSLTKLVNEIVRFISSD